MRYRFGPFEVDEDRYALTRDGEPVEIRPKPFELLLYLLRHKERTPSKHELLDALWPGVAVAEASLTTAVRGVRRALAEKADATGMLETVRGRGYKIAVPIEVLEPTLPSDERPPATPLPDSRAGFLGRKPEMTELESRLARAHGGHGGLIMLSGEPGIGKTRITRECAARAAASGALVLWGRGYEGPGAPAYWPWVQLIRAYAETCEAETLARFLGSGAPAVAEIVPDLRDKLPDLGLARPVRDANRARFRLFDSVARFLCSAAEGQTLLLALDDLHGADEPSLLLLDFLAQQLVDSRILVLGTFRDTELHNEHPLHHALAGLERTGVCTRMPLEGFNRQEVADFIRANSEAEPSASLVESVHKRTEGNPLFVSEVVRWLHQEVDLSRSEPDPGSKPSLPEGVREAIGQRLGALSDPCREVLTLASLLGREFGFEELQGLVSTGLLDALDEAIHAHLIVPVTDSRSRYQFSHILVAETLYAELSTARRIELHGQVGTALEHLHREYPGPHLAELAHHFFEAARGGEVERAVQTCVRAAERSGALLAFEEAIRLYQMALDALTLEPNESKRCTLLRGLAGAQSRSGRFAEALKTLNQGADLARALDEPQELVRMALDAVTWPSARWQSIEGLMTEALAAMDSDKIAHRARLLAPLAWAHLYSGQRERGREVAQQALDAAQLAGDAQALAFVRTVKTLINWPPTSEQLWRDATEVITLAEQAGDSDRLFDGHFMRAMSLLELGDLSAFDVELEGLDRGEQEVGDPFYSHIIRGLRAMRALFEGRFEQAEKMAAENLALGQRIEALNAEGAFGLQMFTLRRERGRLKEIEPALRRFAAQGSATWQPGLALIYSELGLHDQAHLEFERLAVDDFAGLEHDALWLGSMAYLAEVCEFLDDRARAETLYGLLSPWNGKYVVVGGGAVCLGAVARYLGLLAATQGDLERASEHYEAALKANARSGGRPYCAHTEYDYARLLLERGGSKARKRASEFLTSAHKTAESLGMARLVEQTGAELNKLDARRTRT